MEGRVVWLLVSKRVASVSGFCKAFNFDKNKYFEESDGVACVLLLLKETTLRAVGEESWPNKELMRLV